MVPRPFISIQIQQQHREQERLDLEEEEKNIEEGRLGVKAYYMARSIDVSRLYERSHKSESLRRRRYGRESAIFSTESEERVPSWYDDAQDERLFARCGHVVVFTYGSVVFFNVDPDTQKKCLDFVSPFCNEAIPKGFRPTEDYHVIARENDDDFSEEPQPFSNTSAPPHRRVTVQAASGSRAAAVRREPATPLTTSLGGASKVLRRRRSSTEAARSSFLGEDGQRQNDLVDGDPWDEPRRKKNLGAEIRFDAVVLPRLDVHNLSVIATVMAQTVALDHYSVKVDAMLETFTRLNSSVEKTGVFNALEKQNLFKLVALNNTLFTDVIAKIGLLERSETAWRSQEYTQIWEGLREEFEVEDRFEKIEFKLNLVQLNTKFFLEVLANQKSNTLEWIIIVLISLEIIVCSCELCNIRPFG